MRTLSGKRDYLNAMGIDVWSIRPAVGRQSAATGQPSPVPDIIKTMGAAPGTPPSEVSSLETGPPGQAATAEAGTVPRFRLALLHYGSFGICVSLGESGKLPRRFCDDLARVMGCDLEALRYHELVWPMLDTSGIDQSVNAAREVVARKLGALPPRVLVFGDDVAEYFTPLQEAEREPQAVGSQSFLLQPALAETMTSADIKRRLFLSLQAWRHTG